MQLNAYKTQWLATFKNNLHKQTIVYGESEKEAMNNALAFHRKNYGMVDTRGMNDIVASVKYIG